MSETPQLSEPSESATKETSSLPVADDVRLTVETLFKNIAAIVIVFSVATAMATMTMLFASLQSSATTTLFKCYNTAPCCNSRSRPCRRL